MTHVQTFVSPTELVRRLASGAPPCIVDVRRGPAHDADPHRIPGALRGPPEAIDGWSRDLRRDRDVVVYCVHGHEVSQGAAVALAAAGFVVAVLDGGLAGWRAAGHSVIPATTAAPR